MTRPTVVRVYGPVPPPVQGAARVTQHVVAALEAREDARVLVFNSNDGQSTASRLGTLLRGLASLLSTRRRRGSVYLGGAGGELLWYQAVVVLLGRLAGHRMAFHHHNFSPLTSRSAAMALLCRVGGSSLRHIVLCEGMGELLRERYHGVGDVRVCSNAGLLPAPSYDERPPGGPVVLGHLSNLTVDKGLPVVLDSLRHVLAEGLDARLVLAGPCVTPEAERLVAAAREEWPDRLDVLGWVDPDAVDSFYRSVDLFVFPSTYANEAEPLVVLDAMRNGVPSIAYAVGCLPTLVEPSHAVPVDGDLPAVVRSFVRESGSVERRSVAEGFARRREAALAGHAELIAYMVS